MKPEEKARVQIDLQLAASGWTVTSEKDAWKSGAAVAIREWIFPNKLRADYLLFFKGKAIAVVEAKPTTTLVDGAHHQADVYTGLLSVDTSSWRRPLAFAYVANGAVVSFADRRVQYGTHRIVFSFHRPETLESWSKEGESTLPDRLKKLPKIPLPDSLNLRNCQYEAVTQLESSFAQGNRRALIHLATGAGKTFTACTFCYRLVKHAKAKRILFLVDRGNLGTQARDEFAGWIIPGEDRKFTDDYTTLKLSQSSIEGNPKVVISTIQRIYSILTQIPMDDLADELNADEADKQKEVEYSELLPPEYFDFIVIDECHRSIYKKWKGVLEYFDATLIGLTATPTTVTSQYFGNNKVAEYSYEQSVKDGVNVGYCIYRIRTQITEHGGVISAKGDFPAFRRDLVTQQLEDIDLPADLPYEGKDLNRSVESESQVRTVLQAYKDSIYTQLYPDRRKDDEEYNINYIPKTLIFAQTDAHAELITRIAKEVFGRGDDFCKKVTYSVFGVKPQELVRDFRTNPKFRIAVTVDMIATGTDVRPLEVVIFMRDVQSATYYQQMYGRGCRTISDNALKNVTPNAKSKDFFYLVDAVGVTEHSMVTSPPQIQSPASTPLLILMEKAHKQELEEEEWHSLAYRLNRIVLKCRKMGYNKELDAVVFHEKTVNSDGDLDIADSAEFGLPTLISRIQANLYNTYSYCFSFLNREAILSLHRKNSILVDSTTDTLISTGFTVESAQRLTDEFREWIEQNTPTVKALQLIFAVGEKQVPLLYSDLADLLKKLREYNAQFTPDSLWRNFSILKPSDCQVLGKEGAKAADIIQLVKYAMKKESTLLRFSGVARQRFELWLGRKKNAGVVFSDIQREILGRIAELIASNLTYFPVDFKIHDASLIPQAKNAGVGQHINEIYNSLVS